MKEVGIRELRQHASALIRRVERGESIGVTDRGRPVAVLGPVPRRSPLEILLATGELTPAEIGLDELPPPVAIGGEQELPSRVLARLRRDER